MSLPARPAAVIFDLDGTLLDTEPLYSIASQKVLDRFGETYTPELKQRVMGGDSRTSAQTIIDEFGLPLAPEEYLALREVYLLELFAACPEIPGAGDFIVAVHDSGLPLGLATSSHTHLRDVKLAGKSWGELFRASICGDHPRLERSKPAPDIFLLCAKALGVAADRCVVFEDSPNGIAAGIAAGMGVIALASPHVERDDLREASSVIDSFDEALPLLQSWVRGKPG